ncbi:MAG: T9SS type A sorting domain-containing protein [Bacteroidia bacterium]
MRKLFYFNCIIFLACLAIFLFRNKFSEQNAKEREEKSEILEALQHFSLGRSFPYTDMAPDAYAKAFEYFQENYLNKQQQLSGSWESIGPDNIGGRTISVAIDPSDTSEIWLGSASGGLWKSTSGGLGPNAWTYVNTGFPVLGVSSIAIDPANPDVMYIGTGETYNYGTSFNGIVLRTTRGSFGIGILKSIDGGLTWNYSLNWTYQQQRGIWDIVINPKNTNVLYAGTTEGVYKSNDGGTTWSNVLSAKMAMDLEIDKVDTNIVYAGVGNLSSSSKGLYKTSNSGGSWNILGNGLPANSQQGRIIISAYEKNNKILMAMVNTVSNTVGLYRSMNEGQSWILLNNTDFASYQGWYTKGLLIKPDDSSQVMAGGVDLHLSQDEGYNFSQISVGNPSFSNFVHSDIHDIIANPLDPSKVYIISDGGFFRSDGFGSGFTICNEGYVSSQFYIGSVSQTNPSVALGGMQDNSTFKYNGSPSWQYASGGDGCFNAIDPANDNIQYSSWQYLNIYKSTNQGANFYQVYNNTGSAAFVAPFVLCPSNPSVLYAGGNYVLKSTNGGSTWNPTGPNPLSSYSHILSIAVSATSQDTLYCGTEPYTGVPMDILRSDDGALSFYSVSSGLPNRYPRDLVVNPHNSSEVYAVFSGFGTGHIFKSVDAGANWIDLSTALPDLPFHCLAINPYNSANLFAGCDFGVFSSTDGGITWTNFGTGMPAVAMVFDLVVSPADTSLMAYTHGNGVYKRKIADAVTKIISSSNDFSFSLFPNPAKNEVTIRLNGNTGKKVEISIYAMEGKLLSSGNFRLVNKEEKIVMDISALHPGTYTIRIGSANHVSSQKLVVPE